ncbi:MAG TPA: ATP-binding protein, partial [Rhodobacteraceae bacterium]|nr:ATP-binding protein [Paracoccaceae bacterium]
VTTSGVEGCLDIRRDPTREQLELSTDPDRLSQVFINLIANACKYCGAENPELLIRVRDKGEMIEIDFVDNGKGIAAKNQPMLFEKFSRLGDQRAAGGAGLGLAISREIMLNLGGSLTYLPGQGGAAFRVSLPKDNAASTNSKP